MNRLHLEKTAKELKQPSKKASQEFIDKKELIAEEMNKIMSDREDVIKMVGEKNLEMMHDNHRNHARFLASVFMEYDPDVLIETILWVYRAYRTHGFNLSYWPAQLDQWVILHKKHLSAETFNEIYPFYDWMIVNQPAFVAESDKKIEA